MRKATLLFLSVFLLSVLAQGCLDGLLGPSKKKDKQEEKKDKDNQGEQTG